MQRRTLFRVIVTALGGGLLWSGVPAANIVTNGMVRINCLTVGEPLAIGTAVSLGPGALVYATGKIKKPIGIVVDDFDGEAAGVVLESVEVNDCIS